MVVLKNPLLIAFEQVCHLKTVHAAAIQLGLTQAALTKRIRLLESELGLTLFLRSRRGMSLTQEGQALLNYCKSSNEAEGLFASMVKGSKLQEINLTIVGPTSAISTRVNQDCLTLYTKHPNLRLNFKSEDNANLIEMIRLGSADIAVVSPDAVPNEMDSKVLRPDKYLLVASPQWRGRHLEKILEEERIIDFYESDETTLNYLKKFSLDKIKRRNRLYANENEALIRMFETGIGFGTLTETVAKPYIDSGRLIKLNSSQSMEQSLALAWYPRFQKQNYFTDLIQSIK